MNKYMVIDAESVGLHGETFAIGWVVVDESGTELDAQCYATDPDQVFGSKEGRLWIQENVPALDYNCTTQHEVLDKFWYAWLKWKDQGALLVADCAWPVESRMLIHCVNSATGREWNGPYPLHEVATARLLAGFDPLATEQRLPNELPCHNPLNDARQSARLWLEALHAIKHPSTCPDCGGARWCPCMGANGT